MNVSPASSSSEPANVERPEPDEYERGAHLPMLLPRGVSPSEPFRPLDEDDRALLVEPALQRSSSALITCAW
ncbi:MAG: hypothetical protein GY822_01415 [Deltaproteobacteria bacterium]|nr:hypothetical protein [Deltaproteobacteria bacterium]